MKIAVDAMGGDYAPGAVIEGVVLALRDFPTCEIVLVGHETKLKFYLEKYGLAGHPRLKVHHAPDVVEMREVSSTALRAKKHSSITECARLLKEHEVDGIVSAGHTGAAVAATKVLVRTLPGIDRPALAVSMPSQKSRFILVDAGANTDCTPVNLVQFALMGDIYARYLFKLEQASVGLLSVGGEDVKGNDLTKHTFPLLESKLPNFAGNVEANTIFEGQTDVLVCDGYTGNVFLKCSEGMAKSIVVWLKQALTRNPFRMTTASMLTNAFREMKAKGDSEEIGGAVLLGINGICIIGHGSSGPKAVRNAVRVCCECLDFNLNGRLLDRLRETGCSTRELTELLNKNRQTTA